jgi:hypothetical protein
MDYLKKGKCSQTEKALHVHDLIAFKSCRRQWRWSSPFGQHLEPKPSETILEDGTRVTNVNPNLWYGSAMHFALEDFEGTRKFGTLTAAFDAFVEAHTLKERPTDWEDLVEMGHKLFDFLGPWLDSNRDWKIVWQDGKPLTEVKFSLILAPLCYYEKDCGEYGKYRYFPTDDEDIFVCEEIHDTMTKDALELEGAKYVEIVAHGTFDAIVENELGDWYVLDYKSAKAFDTDKLPLDQQISFYSWAASQYFQKEIQGFVYVQITKNPPSHPKVTKTGVSTDKRQRTTKDLYMETCIEHYGSKEAIPAGVRQFWGTIDDSNYVNVQWVERNTHHQEAWYQQILQQGREILNPKLAIYPNPTTDCKWRCPFRTVCIAQEEGADWQYLLTEMFKERVETLTDDFKPWEIKLFNNHPDKYPEELALASKQKTIVPVSEEDELKAFLESEV